MKPYGSCKLDGQRAFRKHQVDDHTKKYPNTVLVETQTKKNSKNRCKKLIEKRKNGPSVAKPIEILRVGETRGRKRKRESPVRAIDSSKHQYALRSRGIECAAASNSELCSRPKKIKPNSSSGSDIASRAPQSNSALASPCDSIDARISFESIGGLREHIECLKEMIVLPVLYPDVFRKYNVQAPRGILFYGPPGTGKTLMAKAVANECNIGTRKVTFFMRKGSDLLSEWIGESERKLRFLFEQAIESRPSIIFFDEIDGLAPVRSSRQDYVHASMVSTLLALMDGIEDRGDVIVIGATNRIDAIDPALRRPGRFDRELLFALPARDEREKILRVQTNEWQRRPSPDTLVRLSEKTVGYCGSDLKALCAESVIQCLRRNYPQVYSSKVRLDIDLETVCVEQCDFDWALSSIVPAQQRIEPRFARKMPDFLKPFYTKAETELKAMLSSRFPHATQPQLSKIKISDRRQQARLLVCADGDEHGQTIHLAGHLLFEMEHLNIFRIDLERLKRHSNTNAIESFVQIVREAQSSVPSIVFVPEIDRLWSLIDDRLKTVIVSKFCSLDASIPLLLLATANVTYDQLPGSITALFSVTRHEIYEFPEPDAIVRRTFFVQLFTPSAINEPEHKRTSSRKVEPRNRILNSQIDIFLENCVQLTEKYSVQSLIDLFNRFWEIVKKPRDTFTNSLAQELKSELVDFNSRLLLDVTNIATKSKTCSDSIKDCSKTYFS